MAQAWFRFYSETLRDRKIERICRQTGDPKAVVVGAWAIILALANDSPVRGALLLTEDVPLLPVDLYYEMGLPEPTAVKLIEAFRNLDMLRLDSGVWYVTHFGDRQYDSDNSTKRVQRYRERHNDTEQADAPAVTETLQQRDGNAPDTETDTETESDTEQKQNSSTFIPEVLSAIEPQPATPPSEKPTIKAKSPPGNGHGKESPALAFTALAAAYRMDTALLTERDRGRLNAVVKRLTAAGYTADEIADAGQFWWADDWRGKKGSQPTDSQFFQVIAQRKAFRAANQPLQIVEIPCQG